MSLPDLDFLKGRLRIAVLGEAAAGVPGLAGLYDDIAAAQGYDALVALAARVAAIPGPPGEPDDLDSILAEADPARRFGATHVPDARARVEAAWLGSVCGNMLGKPLEIATSLRVLRHHLEPHGDWPITDYVSEASVATLPYLQPQWPELVRERIDHVAADDDLNYSVLGMLALERHGIAFTVDDLRRLWLENLPVLTTFGPERTFLAAAAAAAVEPGGPLAPWQGAWDIGREHCGALIRVDAYGYACLGHPALAAELAWRDASMTHRRTGVYGAMFFAAAIAAAPLFDDPLDIFRCALGFVPQRSRFADAVRFGLDEVAAAASWLDAYERLHDRYGDHGHCLVLQEVGTVVNSVRFAHDVGDGICIQVMQGNDTDSFGATAGSILGARFGPGHLDPKWLAPFADTIQLALATTWISSLSELTARMAALPALVSPASPG